MFSPTSPVTGSAQTGLTSPTYTLTSDLAPTANGKQFAVTALGGTQTGVDTHSVSRPFTISAFRPMVLKVLRAIGLDGILRSSEKNTYKVITRKGVTPLAGQASQVMVITTEISVPAGADTADAANVRAALSAHIGCINQQSSQLGDTVLSGTI